MPELSRISDGCAVLRGWWTVGEWWPPLQWGRWGKCQTHDTAALDVVPTWLAKLGRRVARDAWEATGGGLRWGVDTAGYRFADGADRLPWRLVDAEVTATLMLGASRAWCGGVQGYRVCEVTLHHGDLHVWKRGGSKNERWTMPEVDVGIGASVVLVWSKKAP